MKPGTRGKVEQAERHLDRAVDTMKQAIDVEKDPEIKENLWDLKDEFADAIARLHKRAERVKKV